MESGVLLFCAGAISSSILIGGVFWPLRRSFFYLLSPTRTWLYFAISFIFSLSVLTAIIYGIFCLVDGYYSDFGSREYKRYIFMTSVYVSQFVMGVFVGPILFFWMHYYVNKRPTQKQKQAHIIMTTAICLLLVFSLVMPYMNKWFSNATSIEISQIAKINIDAKQNSANQSPTFVSDPTGTSSSLDFKGNDILDSLDQVKNMISYGETQGMLDRDYEYIKLISKGDELKIYERDYSEQIENDKIFLSILQPLAVCLHQYSKEYQDYRLFLVDIKPFISTLSILARATVVVDPKSLKDKLVSQINVLRDNATESLRFKKGINIKRECREVIDTSRFRPELVSFLPYKTIALSYFLTAIGSTDTAIVELGDWVVNYGGEGFPKWHRLRAKIEQNLLLAKVLPGGYKNSIYRKFVTKLVSEYESILPQKSLLEWSARCSKNIYENQLYFQHISQVNMLVKASSNLDDISSDILKYAETNKDINVSCFDNIAYIASDRYGWRAEFLTNYAAALIVSSYDERVYGRSEHPEQKRLREIARKHLFDATIMLQKLSSEYEQGSASSDTDARKIFTHFRWEDTLRTARTLMRSVALSSN